MAIFSFKLLSRYPEIILNNKIYFGIPQITAVRFCINSFIKPKSIRIKNNGKLINEELTNSNNTNPECSSEAYYNIWVNLAGKTGQTGIITIECNYLGVHIPIKRINYKLIGGDTTIKYLNSDSYISPSKISTVNCQGQELEDQISSLPATVRSASTLSIKKNILSIIVLRLDQLGDFVLTISAFNELKNIFPIAKITVIVSPANEQIARSTGFFYEVITIPFSFKEKSNNRVLSNEAKIDVQSKLHGRKYDLAIDLSPMPESRELLEYLPADLKFGFENTNSRMMDFGLLIHAKDPVNCLSNISHAAYPLILIDAVKNAIQPEICHIPLSDDSRDILPRFELIAQKYIVVHSGARNLLVRWPIDKFISLTGRLALLQYKIVFFADEKLSNYERALLGSNNEITVIDEQVDFYEFEMILANARLFVGNDSGPKHLAAMRGVPVVSVHSPRTNWSEWGQVDSGQIISKRVPCAGCAITTKHQCTKNLLCISLIEEDKVYEVIISTLNP